MGSHTLIKKRKDMPRAPLPQCHGGEGTLDWIRILDGEDTVCGHLGFMHDDILPSGTSMGVHRHERDEEYHFLVSGEGVMILDDERFDVQAGDITAVYPGGSHGLENNSGRDLRILVVSVS